jgi:hypothetical protein
MVSTVYQATFMIDNYLPVQGMLVLLCNYNYHYCTHKIPPSALTLFSLKQFIHSDPVLLGSVPIPSPEPTL